LGNGTACSLFTRHETGGRQNVICFTEKPDRWPGWCVRLRLWQAMHPGNAGESVPLVGTAFPPTGYPVDALLLIVVRADFAAAAGNASLVSTVVCSARHIALVSFHWIASSYVFKSFGLLC